LAFGRIILTQEAMAAPRCGFEHRRVMLRIPLGRDLTMRCRFVAALSVLVLVAQTACSAAQAAEVTFGITSATAFSLAHYIATEKKFYAAEGLAVETVVAGAAVGVLQQLAAGSLNMAQAATDQTLRAVLRGAPIRIVAGAAANAPFRMVAAKTVK